MPRIEVNVEWSDNDIASFVTEAPSMRLAAARAFGFLAESLRPEIRSAVHEAVKFADDHGLDDTKDRVIELIDEYKR